MTDKEYARRAHGLRQKLYRTALLYLSDESSALEAVDEAVYKGLRGHKKLRQEEYFDTWLTRILINECRNEQRRRQRVQPVETLPETAVEAFDALPLKEAVRRLPGELQEIVILRYFAGYTLQETAEALAIPRGTVATRQRRALALLRLELDEEVEP